MVAAFYLVVLVLLWMTRDPGFAPGWGALFKTDYVPDASPAVVIAFLAVLTPAALAHIGSAGRQKEAPLDALQESSREQLHSSRNAERGHCVSLYPTVPVL